MRASRLAKHGAPVVEDGSKLSMKSGRTGRTLVARRGVPAACPPQITLRDATESDILNDEECLLPYPSTRFLVPADTPTGLRLELPQIGLPAVNGPLTVRSTRRTWPGTSESSTS